MKVKFVIKSPITCGIEFLRNNLCKIGTAAWYSSFVQQLKTAAWYSSLIQQLGTAAGYEAYVS